ncbi:MAG TPA: AAA family ATPase, partial [Solirubrobacteraceae bacterium]|nr:AAA family ATPase [Solirubrobacteraceae bacterium]
MKAGGPTAAELLERDFECDRLAVAIDAALAGEGSAVALEGEAGIGKSSLLAHVTRRGRDAGMRVLTARGGELEREFAYGVVRQLFDGPLMALDSHERESVLGGAAGLALPALSGTDRHGGAAADPGSVLHGLYWLTANLAAGRPLLITVDDAHWADNASIAFLAYLARRIDGLALLVVYATRVAEGADELLPATAERGLVSEVLRPGVLSAPATLELIGWMLGSDSSDEFAHACRVATAGNPFLLQELLRALQADGITPDSTSCERVAQIAPGAISRAILARLRRLGRPATRLAFATAVLGKSAALRHAAALAELDLGAAGTAADTLTSAAILGDGRPLEFIHPIVRTTVYAEIPAAQRAASHMRAALLLEADGADAAELAPHLMATEPAGDPGVVRRLRAAADDVRDRGAPDAACDYLARALAEPPAPERRADVTYELGSAELSAGRGGAIAHLRDALGGDLDPRLQMAAATDFAGALSIAGEVQQGVELLASLIAKLDADGDAETAMKLEGVFACTAQLDPATSPQVRTRLARWEGRLRGDSVGERLLLASMAFDAAHRPVPAAHAAELAELALGDGRLLREQTNYAANFPLAAWTLVWADRLERAEQLYTLAIDHAHERGSLIGFAIATGCRSQVRFRQGRIAEAEAEARSMLDDEAGVWRLGRPMLIACVIDAMVERADVEACERFLATHGIDEDMAAYSMGSRLLHSRGHLRLVAGDPAGALRDFEQIRGREQRSRLETAAVPTRGSAALAHAQLGEHERARELAGEELERARVWGTPSALSFALRTAGVVAGGDEGLELLRGAAAAGEHSPARYEHVRSLVEYGAALRRAGRRSAAREPLREALELADRCGALRTAARARDELLATGARPRRAARSGADALTPSERRVCRLAADGLGNRDIAQALFVTVRTVEGHLTLA